IIKPIYRPQIASNNTLPTLPKLYKPFPYYDTLCNEARGKNMTIEEFSRLCPIINNLPDEHHEILFAIIIHYAILKGENKPVPYSGVRLDTGRGVLYQLKNGANTIPNELLAILATYVKHVTM